MSLLSKAKTPGSSAHVNEDFIRDCSTTWRALFNTTDDEMYVVLNTGFAIGQVHPSDTGQKILDIKVDLVSANTTDPATNLVANLWNISLTYGAWDPLTHSIDGNPINLPLRFRIDFTVAEVAAFEDVDGNPVVNAAGDPYDPPLMREVTRCSLTVLRNEVPSSVNLATLAALSNTLNVATWNGFPPKTARLAPLKLPEVLYSQVSNSFYFPMEYNFEINFDTWVKQIINAGFRQLDADGNLIPILINGQPATTPVPLDEEGHAILTPEFKSVTGSGDTSGDTPPDTNSGGESGEVAGGGEPPSGGTGELESNIVIDAYDLIRTSDFTALSMDSIFTLPTI